MLLVEYTKWLFKKWPLFALRHLRKYKRGFEEWILGDLLDIIFLGFPLEIVNIYSFVPNLL